MCGIVGIISITDNRTPIHSTIVKMCDSMRQRGLDGEGFLLNTIHEKYAETIQQERPSAYISITKSNRRVAFGHRRLSILDLSQLASQPMRDHTGRYWIVFNGEIYNHAEIRTELENKGHKFISNHSDTEVILESYKEWGTDCLQKFNGMFAFCVWDKEEDVFFLVRDRLGIKPFYWTIFENNFYFSSESKTFTTLEGFRKEIEASSLLDYLSYAAVTSPNTLLSGVYKLPAAHFISIKSGIVEEARRYWNPLDSAIEKKQSEADVVERINSYIQDSALKQFIADVPVGIFLSGGLDSSTLLATLAPKYQSRLKSFSIGFSNSIAGYNNEFKYAKQVSEMYGTDHTVLEINPQDYLDSLPEMIRYQDEPITDPAAIPIFLLSKIAKQNNVKVVLGGEGSDELLTGYQLWRFAQQFDVVADRLPNSILKLAKTILKMPLLRNKRVFYQDWLQNKICSGLSLRGTSDLWQADRLLNSLQNQYPDLHPDDNILKYKKIFQQSGRNSTPDWLSFLDINFHLPESLLARFDKMTMAAGIEGRVPFLDHRFVEYCFSIPYDMKMKNKTEKYLLKKAMNKKLPDDVISRRKDGFTIPMKQILKTNLFEYGMENLKQFNNNTQIFKKAFIENIFKTEKSNVTWNIINLSIWWNNILS